jgi:hypothetical protein
MAKPTNVNKNIKVSQGTIDSIKKMGMKAALEMAATNKGAEQSGAVAEIQEGVRRLYGERRFQAATYKPNNVSSSTTSNFTYSNPVVPRKVDSFRAGERSTVSKPASKPAANTNKVWNPNTDSVLAKGLKGVGASLRKAYQGK